MTSQDAGTVVRIRRECGRLSAEFVPGDADGEGHPALPRVALLGAGSA
ncbi:hypothetical protein ACIRU3_33040 [Streptomyces sp. NPDC101151]